MAKWKLMITTLPFVAVVLGVKLLLEFVIKWQGVVDFSDIGIILTAGVFLTGFMLGGTMADYKESEKLPGEVACQLEAIEDLCMQGAALKSLPTAPLRTQLLAMTDAIHDWLFKKKTQVEMFAALAMFQSQMAQFEKEGGGGHAGKTISELHSLRKMVTRMAVISRTGFLPPAYALLDALVVLIIALILASKYKSTLAMCILVPFITLIYVYMVRLIRDVDDPFEYDAGGVQHGGAEVELFPLDEYRDRLKKRIQG